MTASDAKLALESPKLCEKLGNLHFSVSQAECVESELHFTALLVCEGRLYHTLRCDYTYQRNFSGAAVMQPQVEVNG